MTGDTADTTPMIMETISTKRETSATLMSLPVELRLSIFRSMIPPTYTAWYDDTATDGAEPWLIVFEGPEGTTSGCTALLEVSRQIRAECLDVMSRESTLEFLTPSELIEFFHHSRSLSSFVPRNITLLLGLEHLGCVLDAEDDSTPVRPLVRQEGERLRQIFSELQPLRLMLVIYDWGMPKYLGHKDTHIVLQDWFRNYDFPFPCQPKNISVDFMDMLSVMTLRIDVDSIQRREDWVAQARIEACRPEGQKTSYDSSCNFSQVMELTKVVPIFEDADE